jgi:hypothetical protein
LRSSCLSPLAWISSQEFTKGSNARSQLA